MSMCYTNINAVLLKRRKDVLSPLHRGRTIRVMSGVLTGSIQLSDIHLGAHMFAWPYATYDMSICLLELVDERMWKQGMARATYRAAHGLCGAAHGLYGAAHGLTLQACVQTDCSARGMMMPCSYGVSMQWSRWWFHTVSPLKFFFCIIVMAEVLRRVKMPGYPLG